MAKSCVIRYTCLSLRVVRTKMLTLNNTKLCCLKFIKNQIRYCRTQPSTFVIAGQYLDSFLKCKIRRIHSEIFLYLGSIVYLSYLDNHLGQQFKYKKNFICFMSKLLIRTLYKNKRLHILQLEICDNFKVNNKMPDLMSFQINAN